ncbi:MAG TPA: endolytic transglycosylase MltG [bacterium]
MKLFKWYKRVLGVIALLLLYVFCPAFFFSGQDVNVSVYVKSSAREIARQLEEKGVLHFALPFRLLTKLTHADRHLQAGLYRMNPRMSLWEVLTTLSEGKSELLALKVPEGYTTEQVGQELEKMKVATVADFLKAAQDPQLLKTLGIDGPSVEGFLYPETYRVPLGASPAELVELMVRQFQDEIGSDFNRRCLVKNLTPYQAVILASIVEKEAKLAEERPIIAGVLYNRLHQKIRLQVNATLNYILNSKNPWFTNDQINTRSPYNTYLHRGLPPTPICNPGLASLQGVLNPADVPYLYYVSNGDGSHVFSETFQEHSKNVRQAKKIFRKKRKSQTLPTATPNP